MTSESFWQLYEALYEELRDEKNAHKSMTAELSKTKTALDDAMTQVQLFKERALDAEQALSDMGSVISEGQEDKAHASHEKREILARFRDLQEELDEERASHERCKVESVAKVSKLESEIDTLRQRLQYLEEELKSCETVASPSPLDAKDAIQKLLEKFFALFPQSRSENEYQFCSQHSGDYSPAFLMLLTLAYEDMTFNIKHVAQMIDSPEHLAQTAITLDVSDPLCRYMRVLQVVNVKFFSDVSEALQKQAELTRHTIDYENADVIHCRQIFVMSLVEATEIANKSGKK